MLLHSEQNRNVICSRGFFSSSAAAAPELEAAGDDIANLLGRYSMGGWLRSKRGRDKYCATWRLIFCWRLALAMGRLAQLGEATSERDVSRGKIPWAGGMDQLCCEDVWETMKYGKLKKVAGSRSYSKAETQNHQISKEGMEKPGTVITDKRTRASDATLKTGLTVFR